MTETDLMNLIEIEVSKLHCRIFRANAGSFRSLDGKRIIKGFPKGFPDLVGWNDKGQILLIECKVHPNKPTPEQLKFIALAKKFNCKAGVAYSVEEAIKIVES